MPSVPGADEGEDLESASLICSLVRGVAEGFFFRRPLLGRGSLGGKKWSRSPLLIATRPEAWGMEGNLGVGLMASCCSAVQMLSGELFAQEISPVGSLCSFDGFGVAEPGVSSYAVRVGGLDFFWLSGRLS